MHITGACPVSFVIPGVAKTSMATAMAERMGVTFDELSARFAQKRRSSLRAQAS